MPPFSPPCTAGNNGHRALQYQRGSPHSADMSNPTEVQRTLSTELWVGNFTLPGTVQRSLLLYLPHSIISKAQDLESQGRAWPVPAPRGPSSAGDSNLQARQPEPTRPPTSRPAVLSTRHQIHNRANHRPPSLCQHAARKASLARALVRLVAVWKLPRVVCS